MGFERHSYSENPFIEEDAWEFFEKNPDLFEEYKKEGYEPWLTETVIAFQDAEEGSEYQIKLRNRIITIMKPDLIMLAGRRMSRFSYAREHLEDAVSRAILRHFVCADMDDKTDANDEAEVQSEDAEKTESEESSKPLIWRYNRNYEFENKKIINRFSKFVKYHLGFEFQNYWSREVNKHKDADPRKCLQLNAVMEDIEGKSYTSDKTMMEVIDMLYDEVAYGAWVAEYKRVRSELIPEIEQLYVDFIYTVGRLDADKVSEKPFSKDDLTANEKKILSYCFWFYTAEFKRAFKLDDNGDIIYDAEGNALDTDVKYTRYNNAGIYEYLKPNDGIRKSVNDSTKALKRAYMGRLRANKAKSLEELSIILENDFRNIFTFDNFMSAGGFMSLLNLRLEKKGVRTLQFLNEQAQVDKDNVGSWVGSVVKKLRQEYSTFSKNVKAIREEAINNVE